MADQGPRRVNVYDRITSNRSTSTTIGIVAAIILLVLLAWLVF